MVHVGNMHNVFSVQKLDLQKNHGDDSETVRGQIVISLISRDRGGGGGSGPAVQEIQDLSLDSSELPDG